MKQINVVVETGAIESDPKWIRFEVMKDGCLLVEVASPPSMLPDYVNAPSRLHSVYSPTYWKKAYLTEVGQS